MSENQIIQKRKKSIRREKGVTALIDIECAHAEEVSGKISNYRKNRKIKFLSSEFNDFTVSQIKKVLGRSSKVYGKLLMLGDNEDWSN